MTENRVSVKVESSNLPSTRNYNRELLKVRAVWIADIFPDELVIQERTVSVIRNEFLVSYVETMPVKDIGRVVYVNTPLFAGIKVLGKNTAHELHIKGLRKRQALWAKDILEGLLLEKSGDIDIPDWWHIADRREALAREGGRHSTPHKHP
jgi:hypothetical protein